MCKFSILYYILYRLKLFQKPQVIFKEQAQVVDLIFEHGNAFYSHSESESSVFCAVNATVFQYIRVNHSAAQDFYPSASFADVAAFSAADVARDIHLGAGFCEGEIRWTKAYFGVARKHLFGEVIEGLF